MDHNAAKLNNDPRRSGVVLCGAYGYGNAGDEAILEAVVTELRSIDPQMPICVMTRKPQETRDRLGVDACYTFDFPAFRAAMKKSALYLNGGGSLMQNVTSRRSLWFYLYTLHTAKKLGNKVLMYGCGIGPINRPADRRLAARIISRSVDAITLRDPHSKEELEAMGVTGPEIILSADPTVVLPAATGPVIDSLLERRGMCADGRYIGFTVRPWPGFDLKSAAFAAAADYAYQRHGLTPVFIPIEGRHDVAVARRVAAHVTVPCHIIEETTSTDRTLGLFGRMEAVVSMRLHALIFAASQGVPLLGVVYDPKVSSFLDYIGQDLYLPLADVTADKLKEGIDAVVARGADQTFLADAVNRLRAAEGRNRETACRLLGKEVAP